MTMLLLIKFKFKFFSMVSNLSARPLLVLSLLLPTILVASGLRSVLALCPDRRSSRAHGLLHTPPWCPPYTPLLTLLHPPSLSHSYPLHVGLQDPDQRILKILVVGEAGTGKTSMIRRCVSIEL